MEGLVCIFDPSLDELSRHIDWSPSQLEECLHLRSPSLAQTLAQIERELQAPGFASNILLEGLVAALKVQLTRHFTPQAARVGRKPLVLDQSKLRKIESYVQDLDGRMPRASEIAALCGMTERQVMRAFKSTTGCTLSDYIASCQVERAKQLLVGTGLCLKEISYKLGFSSHSNFTNSFRRSTGQCPSEFRRGAY
jgi:AraC family transcriptional regulator